MTIVLGKRIFTSGNRVRHEVKSLITSQLGNVNEFGGGSDEKGTRHPRQAERGSQWRLDPFISSRMPLLRMSFANNIVSEQQGETNEQSYTQSSKHNRIHLFTSFFRVPTSSDDVVVNSGATQPTLSGNVSVQSLTINASAVATIAANSKLTLTGSGTPLSGAGSLDTTTNTPLIQMTL